MWKAKVWVEGKWLWFTSTAVGQDDAEDDILAQAVKFFNDWHKDKKFEEAMFVIEEMERIEDGTL